MELPVFGERDDSMSALGELIHHFIAFLQMRGDGGACAFNPYFARVFSAEVHDGLAQLLIDIALSCEGGGVERIYALELRGELAKRPFGGFRSRSFAAGVRLGLLDVFGLELDGLVDFRHSRNLFKEDFPFKQADVSAFFRRGPETCRLRRSSPAEEALCRRPRADPRRKSEWLSMRASLVATS